MAEGVAEARVKINGTEVPKDKLSLVVVEQDVDQPDMCAATLSNLTDSEGGGQKYTETLNQGDEVEVSIGATTDTPTPIFKGEVVGIEPLWDVSGETKVLVRAFNKLHRLTRTRKSKTFENMTDSAIVQKIAGEYGLSPEVKGSVNITHKHVYQHHQTDLEFLLSRARRIDYEVMCEENTKLIFRKRDTSVDSGIELKWGKDASGAEYALQRFQARLNTSNQVKEVTVRCWDPTKTEEIIGKASSLDNKLGKTDGASAANTFGEAKASYEVPVSSKEEADAIAKALLEDAALNYITGDGQCKGHNKLKPGIVVKIDAKDTRFNGKYYITGCSHRYTHKGGGSDGGYLTYIRVRRNADDK